MTARTDRSPGGHDGTGEPGDIGHPIGTLVIVGLYGLLLGLGWLAMYFLRFLAHGAPHP